MDDEMSSVSIQINYFNIKYFVEKYHEIYLNVDVFNCDKNIFTVFLGSITVKFNVID